MDALTRLALGGGSHARPSDAALRQWRGAFCIPNAIPNLASHLPNFTQRTEDPNRIWTPAYGCYDDAGRALIRQAFRARGYTHFVYNWLGFPYSTDYPLLQPDPSRARRDLLELTADGLIPAVCLLDEALRAETAYLQPLAAACADLLWVGFLMWECNEVLGVDSLDGRDQWTGLVGSTAQTAHAMLPAMLIFAHFTPGHGSGGSPESDWWKDFSAGNPSRGIPPNVLAGKLDQTDSFDDAQQTAAGLESTAVRLAGVCPPAPGNWAGCATQTVRYEFQTTVLYHDGRTEQQGLDFSRQVVAGSTTCVGTGDSVNGA